MCILTDKRNLNLTAHTLSQTDCFTKHIQLFFIQLQVLQTTDFDSFKGVHEINPHVSRFFYFNLTVCVNVSTSVQLPVEAGRGVAGAEVTNRCKHPWRGWEWKPRPLQESQQL